MDGFKLNDVSDVCVGEGLAKQVYAGDTKIWDYKTTPVYTAPTAKTGLVYSGSAQALLNAGSTSHGTIQYSSDGSTWSTTIPTSTNANTNITVYWRLVGDSRHTDIISTAITCSIAKAAPTYTAPTAKSGLVYNNTNQALLNAGSTSHGTIQYSSDGSSWGTSIPTGKNATSYTVYWRLNGDSNHSGVSSKSISCSIAKVTPTVTAPTAKTLTYSGSAQALVNAGSTNWGTLKYSLDNSTWGTSVPTGTNATSYTVYYKVVGDSNINDVAAKSVACSIGKVTPTVTAPTAKVLAYNTSAQALVNAGSTNFGTLQYSLNNSTWSTSIPTATNQGSYTVYYKVVGDSNINDVASKSVACSINEKKVTATVTLGKTEYTYSGSACEPAVTVKDGSTVIPAYEYTVSYSNNTNAGTATVTISDNTGGNYEVIGSATFTIAKAAGVAGVSSRSLTYSRSSQSLATVSGNTGTVHYRLGTSGSWSTSIPSATNAGSYTICYYVDASANYNGVASSSSPNSVTTNIAQVTPVLSTSPSLVTGLTYTGSAQNLLSGGAMKHSSSDTTAVGGTFTYTEQTNAGTYSNPTWSFTPTDTTNYKSTSGTITGSVTIAKATGTATVSSVSVSYNGSAKNLVSVSGNTGTMHYRLGTGGTWGTSVPTATNAASYDVYWYMDESSNYGGLHSSSSPAKVTSSIAKINPTITAPTAKTGLVYNGSEQTLWNAGSNTTAGSFSYSKGTNAGNYNATWTFTPTDTTNYKTKSGSATISIAKAAGSISYATTSVSKTYGNAAFTNTLTKSGDGSVTYASSATGVAAVNSSGQVTIAGAGSATITATVTDGTNYTYATKTASYTLDVAKATPTVTAPTAKSLTYSGSAQTLINAGSTTGGTLQYKLGSGSYGTGLPSATAKGTYTVYYKVVGNSNYNDVAEKSISVSIAAKALTITAKDQSVSYGTAISTGTSQVTVSGLVSGDSLTAVTLTQSTTNVTSNGTITPSAAATTNGAGNYSVTYNTGKLTITAVSPVKTNPAKVTGLTFSGAAQNLVTAGSSSHGTFTYKLSTASSYGSGIPTGTNAGTYAVDWKFVADANHGGETSTGSITGISIAVKALTITAKAQTVNYGTAITQGTGQVTTSGLVSGDSLTAITLTQSTTNVTTTGTITPSAATTTKGIGNYSVTYNTGTLTINKVGATVATAPSAKSLTFSGNAQALVNAGTPSGGTMYYQMTTSNSKPTSTSGFSTTIPTGTNAGTYYVWYYVKGDSNHNDSAISSSAVSVTIANKSISIPTPTGVSRAYNGNAATATFGAATGASITKYRYGTNNSTWTETTTNPSQTNVGTLYVQAYYTAGTNYTGSGWSASATLAISQVTPTVTAPTAKVLTYNTSAQALVNAGSTNFGTLQYSLNNSTWSTSIPTATNQGSYTVYYRVVGDTNIKDVASASVACSINEKKVTATVTLSKTSYTYSGSACTPTVTVKDGSTVIPASEYSVAYSNNTNAGTATVTISDNAGGNYEVIGSATFTINQADGVAGVSNRSLTYSRGAQNLVTVSGNTGTVHYRLGTGGSWTTTIPKATTAGSYTVYYYVDASTNYKAVGSSSSPGSVSTTIAKATPVASTAPTKVSDWTYDGSAHNLASGGAMKHSSSDTTAVAGAFTYDQATDAGSYSSKKWYFTPTDTTNYNSTNGTISGTVTVSKATGTATVSGRTVTYSRGAQNMVSVSGNTGTMHYRVGTGGTWTTTIPTRTTAGSDTIYWYMDASTNYTAKGSASSPAGNVTGTVSKCTPVLSTNPTKTADWTYDGQSHALASGGAMKHSSSDSTAVAGTFSYGSATNAGSHSATWSFTPTDTTNYNTASGNVGTVTVAKATGATGYSTRSLTYSRSAQSLGTVSGNTGTNHYRLGTSGSWGTTIPTATNAGSYDVYVYTDAATNYNAVGSSSSPVKYTSSIAKVTPVLSTSPTYRTGLSYTGSAQNLLTGGAMKHSSSDTTAVAGTFTYDQGTNAGTYSNKKWYFTPTDTTNYNGTNGTVSGSTSIAKISVHTAPVANNAAYSRSAIALLKNGSANGKGTLEYSTNGTSGWTITVPTQTNAGSYDTWWRFTPTDTTNHNSVSATKISTTIVKANPYLASNPSRVDGLVYNGSAQNLLSGGSMQHSSSDTTAVAGTFSYTQGTNAGTYSNIGFAFTPTDSTNYNSVYGIGYGNGSISARPINITAASNSKTYDGSALTANSATAEATGTNRGLVSGHSMTSCTVTGTITNAGTADNVPSAAVIKSGSVDVTSNYDITYVNGTLTVSKATGTATVSGRTVTYSRGAQNMVSVSNNTGTMHYRVGTSGSWTTTIPTRTNAGSDTIYYYMDASTNYTARGSSSSPWGNVTGKVNKCTPVASTAPTKVSDWTYDGQSHNLASGGAMKHSSTDSTAVAGTFTYDQATDAGTYSSKKWYFAPTDTTNYNSTNGTISGTVTVSKASRTLSFADASVVMDTNSTYTQTVYVSAGSGDGAITYSVSNTSYATINSSTGAVTSKSYDGSITVTASIAEGTNYLSDSAAYNITIFATVHDFSYTGAAQTVALLGGSSYKIQCWGAQGGANSANSGYGITAQAGGKGGYSEGTLSVLNATPLKVYVGGQGTSSAGGFNGGGSTSGSSSYNASNEYGLSYMGGGGGATDIRLSDGALLSRMIVAGGGSGGAMCYKKVTTQQTVSNWETIINKSTSGNAHWTQDGYYVVTMAVALEPNQSYIFGYSGPTPSKIWICGNGPYNWNPGTSSNPWKPGGTNTVPVYLGWTDGYHYDTFTVKQLVSSTEEVVNEYNDYQAGYAGGGTTGGGYSSAYQGRQNAAGSGGAFGQGAGHSVNNYRYCGAGGGGGWYGGGTAYSNSGITYCRVSGGGSGFVNTAANASYRPSGYTGLELDSGSTYAGNTTFVAPGGGNETGHAGNGYVRITRL